MCLMWEAYCSGAYSNNVKFMYTSSCGHIIDCIEFIRGIYMVMQLHYILRIWLNFGDVKMFVKHNVNT